MKTSDDLLWSIVSDDIHYMGLALDQARAAAALGEVPVGCVVVSAEGEVIATGHNRTRTDASPLAHAELLGIAAAVEATGYERLLGCTVYVTLEPCFMCAGALIHARVARVVWGARDPKFGGCASLGEVLTDTRLNHRCRVTEGIRIDECRELLQGFFRARRGTRKQGEPDQSQGS